MLLRTPAAAPIIGHMAPRPDFSFSYGEKDYLNAFRLRHVTPLATQNEGLAPINML